MKVIRHARHADGIMRIEGTLAVAGVGGGILLWAQAGRWDGYVCAVFAFLALLGVRVGFCALRTYNRYQRGAAGEDAVLAALRGLPETYTAITNFVAPGTRQGDIDLVILGPAGILVVEIKAYTGEYGCHGDTWFRVHPDGSCPPLRSSVSRQLKRARKAVQHYLVDYDAAAPVHAVAVFRPGVTLHLTHPTVPVVLQSDLEAHLLNLPPAPPGIGAAALTPLFAPSPGRRLSFLSPAATSSSESPA